MDVVLTENQTVLHDATRRFVQDRSPVAQARKLSDAGLPFPPEAWRECAAQGWIGLFVPAAHGGIAEEAQGVIDAAIVAEELGRTVFAGPFLPNCVAAFALAQAGSDAQCRDLLPDIAAGEARAAWCYAKDATNSGLSAEGVAAHAAGTGFEIDGVAGFVEDAQHAERLLVTARDGAGLSQFIVPCELPGITIEPLKSLDLARAFGKVRFDKVAVGSETLVGRAGAAGALFERQLQVALVLQCAELVGLIDRAFEFTLEWVQQRFAFGRPIGSFQALKHRLADHIANLETAKAAVAYAARAVETEASDAAIAVSIAKSQCGQQGVEIIRDCVQMHGGIGLTWEHDLHFYLRRAVSSQSLLGTPAQHHERVAELAGL